MWSAFFPGQGSQHSGMGKFLYDEFKVARECFEEASDAVSVDFKKLCFEGSEADLALTENTQPTLVLVSTATFKVLANEFGFQPAMGAGHSVGEYSALVAAQSLDLTSGIRAVRARGQSMQNAVPVGQGGMTAVMGLEPAKVNELCAWAEKSTGESPVQAANINAPGQIVISGRKSLLDWIGENFKPEVLGVSGRVKFIPLKVSAPFHCAMMKPAEETMRQVLNDMPIREARFPVIQNVSAEPVTEAGQIRENLIQQVCAPVRWIECVETAARRGATRGIEVGCGKVISGLVKKITPKIEMFNINSMDDLRAAESALKG